MNCALPSLPPQHLIAAIMSANTSLHTGILLCLLSQHATAPTHPSATPLRHPPSPICPFLLQTTAAFGDDCWPS